jgi:peptidyl-prolyl cis-trans isomerase A (cyclophilin A)
MKALLAVVLLILAVALGYQFFAWTSLDRRMGRQDLRLDEVSRQLADQGKALDATQRQVTEYGAKIEALDRKLSEAAERIEAKGAEIKALTNQVTEAVSSIRSKESEFAAVLKQLLEVADRRQGLGIPDEKTVADGDPPPPERLNPAQASERAPDTFKVKLATTKGDIIIDVHRDWAPKGADRFYNLVKIGYFTDLAFFRVVDGFMAQFGIHGDPRVSAKWRAANIQDDPVKESNLRGYITFATAGPNTRSTQFFINFGNNTNLDRMGFAPFGKVAQGMVVVDSIYKGYGEGAPRGRGPDQGRIQGEGNAYLKASFPNLDYVKSAAIVP